VFALFTTRFVGNSRGALARSDPDYKRPGYNIVDATIGYDWKTWEFALFAKNLTDSDKIIQRTNTLGFSGATRLRPVTIGLSALTTF
jgi:outer membrane receptor protein involved in Fe transport